MSRSNLLGTLLFLGFIVLSNSVYVISETQRGVLLKFGEVVKSDLEPGLHFKTPFVNSVRKFDGRILTVDSTPERFFYTGAKATHRRFVREVSCGRHV